MSGGLEAARRALAGGSAWLVGGAVRDRLLGRSTGDLDVVVAGNPADAARATARAASGAACFALSEDFGSWRVVARDRAWQLDVAPFRGASIESDLALATSRSTRSPSRSPGVRYRPSTGASRTCAAGGSGWSARGRSPPIRSAC